MIFQAVHWIILLSNQKGIKRIFPFLEYSATFTQLPMNRGHLSWGLNLCHLGHQAPCCQTHKQKQDVINLTDFHYQSRLKIKFIISKHHNNHNICPKSRDAHASNLKIDLIDQFRSIQFDFDVISYWFGIFFSF